MWKVIASSRGTPLGLGRAMRRSACRRVAMIAFAGMALLWGSPAWAAGGCPSSNAITNFLIDNNVQASFQISSVSSLNDTATYTVSSIDESSTGGVPGLIEYCVYPIQPPGNPDMAVADYSDVNGTWDAVFGSIQGYFSFKRYDGNPSNVPFDGSQNVVIGTATWCQPVAGSCTVQAPGTQTILLHVNDPTVCSSLYNDGSSTCFVYPGLENGPPIIGLCNGATVCKDVEIDQAITDTPLTVPGNTLLNLHYTYTIVNQNTVASGINMLFIPPTPKTSDINSGGGKDAFGCEQVVDTLGTPGAWKNPVPNYQNTGFTLNPLLKTGTCSQYYFNVQAPSSGPITLAPGQSITFVIDMVTGRNPAHKQEYTECGIHLLNSGFTAKWFQYTGALTSAILKNPGTLHSASTNVNPIYVNVVTGGTLNCPSS
jgi:hypothetical protein